MLVLGINTVADVCETALVDGDSVMAHISEPMTQGHDARLAPVVHQLMSEASVAFNQLDRVAVIVGPGSFTGVRVGVAFARALGMTLGVPTIGVSSLEALDGLPREGKVLGVLAAKRRPPHRSWWVQQIEVGRAVGEAGELDEAGIVALATGVDVVCGEAGDLPEMRARIVAARPSAVAAALFAARLPVGDFPAARPIYVREPDAAPMRPVRS
jgi:tRNA threonylcarbamoyladenosine biosynthesis protein TsaB